MLSRNLAPKPYTVLRRLYSFWLPHRTLKDTNSNAIDSVESQPYACRLVTIPFKPSLVPCVPTGNTTFAREDVRRRSSALRTQKAFPYFAIQPRRPKRLCQVVIVRRSCWKKEIPELPIDLNRIYLNP